MSWVKFLCIVRCVKSENSTKLLSREGSMKQRNTVKARFLKQCDICSLPPLVWGVPGLMYLYRICAGSSSFLLRLKSFSGKRIYKPQCWSRWLNVYLREVRSIPDKATLVRILTRATHNHWITGQGGRGSPPGPLPAWASGRYTVWYTKTSSRASHDRLQSQDYRW